MARLSAGRIYGRMTPAQREAFREKLTGLFLAALARNLGAQSRPVPRVELFRPRIGRAPNQVVVAGRIVAKDNRPTRVEFRFHRTRDGWRVYDVAANGASAVTFYRRYFADIVRRSGVQVLYN